MTTALQRPNRSGLPLADAAATALIMLVLAVALLYPEAYVSWGISVLSRRLLPLVALMPVFALGGAAYVLARRRLLEFGAIDIAIAGYTAYMIARNVTGPNVPVLLKYVVYSLGMFYLMVIVIRSQASRRRIVWFLVVLLGAISLYGILEYIVGENIIYHSLVAELVKEPVSSTHRAGSTVGHPITFGAVLAQLLPFAALAWFDKDDRRLHFAGALGFILGALALLLTFSKGGWIAALITGAIFIFIAGKRVQRKIVIPLLVIMGMLAVSVTILWQSTVIEVASSHRAELSFEGRRVAWGGAVAGITAHPVIGVGLKQGQDELRRQVDPVWLEIADIQLPVDNYYLNILLEEGVLGFLAWMAVLALVIREAILAWKRAPDNRGWTIAALASVVAISINAVTFEALLVWPTYMLFWFAAGSLRGMNLMIKENETTANAA